MILAQVVLNDATVSTVSVSAAVVKISVLPHGGMILNPGNIGQKNSGGCNKAGACSDAACQQQCTAKATKLQNAQKIGASFPGGGKPDFIFFTTPHFQGEKEGSVFYPGGVTLTANSQYTGAGAKSYKTSEKYTKELAESVKKCGGEVGTAGTDMPKELNWAEVLFLIFKVLILSYWTVRFFDEKSFVTPTGQLGFLRKSFL